MKKSTYKLKGKSVGASIARPCFREMPKDNKGITLIALIITIVVMLILVGVTVSFTVGENGILNNAKEAIVKNEKQNIYEQIVSQVKIGSGAKIDVKGTYQTAKSYLEEQGNTVILKLPQTEAEITSATTEIMFEVTGKRGTYTYSIDNKQIVIGSLWMTQEEAEEIYIFSEYSNSGLTIGRYLANEENLIIPSRILMNDGTLAIVTGIDRKAFEGSDLTEEELQNVQLIELRELFIIMTDAENHFGISKEELTIEHMGVQDENIKQIKIFTENEEEKNIVIKEIEKFLKGTEYRIQDFIKQGNDMYGYMINGRLISANQIDRKLKTVVITDTIKTIETCAFKDNIGLEKVTILAKSEDLDSWGYFSYGTFEECDNLNTIEFPNLTIQELTDWDNAYRTMWGANTQGKIVCSDGTIDLSQES